MRFLSFKLTTLCKFRQAIYVSYHKFKQKVKKKQARSSFTEVYFRSVKQVFLRIPIKSESLN